VLALDPGSLSFCGSSTLRTFQLPHLADESGSRVVFADPPPAVRRTIAVIHRSGMLDVTPPTASSPELA